VNRERRARDATPDDIRRQALLAAAAASSKKAEDIVILDVGDIIAITDYFVIAGGANDRQVRTIVDEVERRLREDEGIGPIRVEGLDDARWVLMDYGDFFVHAFHVETRAYYELERLWSDAPRVPFEEAMPPGAVATST
jgi:ribosome-associated protein